MFYALYGVFYNNFSLNLCTAIKLEELQKVNEASEKEASAVREELHNVKKQYEQVKSMLSLLGLDPKQFSKSRRASNSTSRDMISAFNSTEKKLRRHCSLFKGGGGAQAPIMVNGIILQQILPRN